MRAILTIGTLAFAVGAASADIVKPPDLGTYWNAVGPNGTFVYADSFIPENDCVITDLGTWLYDMGTGGSSLRFEVWADNGGPDPFNILSSTGSVAPIPGGGLDYFQYPASGASLSAGTRYWFAITGVGEQGNGFWQVGGHTQNSVYSDNGTFWYSNDPNGFFFDGQNLTPEMAFAVICEIPTPGAAALLGLAGLASARRRR